MRIYNLRRGGGKTTRLLYISEYTGAPILCIDQAHKNSLKGQAQALNIKVPEPIAMSELDNTRGSNIAPNYLVDEALTYLQVVIERLTSGRLSNPLAISFSEKE